MDASYFTNHNRTRNEEKPSSCPTSPVKAPSLGILTRTLVGSSVVRWIIPARIRHETNNDVLFISADSIVIKEAFGNYTIKEVAVKDDFDSPIRAARILGDPRQTDGGDKYSRIMRDTREYKNEEWPVQMDETKSLNELPLHPRVLPPHILVLALESKLVFVCSLNGTADQLRLLWSQHPLPAARWPNEQLGEHLAVDP